MRWYSPNFGAAVYFFTATTSNSNQPFLSMIGIGMVKLGSFRSRSRPVASADGGADQSAAITSTVEIAAGKGRKSRCKLQTFDKG